MFEPEIVPLVAPLILRKSWWVAPDWKPTEMRTTAPVSSSGVLVSISSRVTPLNRPTRLVSPDPAELLASVTPGFKLVPTIVGVWLIVMPVVVSELMLLRSVAYWVGVAGAVVEPVQIY